jgi:DNA-binding PadR family transcriptional regulator
MRERTTRYVLLGMLANWDGMTGFEIRKVIEGSVRHFWRESFGQIYPELKTLAEEGLIKPASRKGRTRDAQPWRITAAGRAALSEWLMRPPQELLVRDELGLKLFFAGHAPESVARDLIEATRQTTQTQLGYFHEAEKEMFGESGNPAFPGALLLLDRGIIAARARLAWCDHALELLDAWEKGGEAMLRKRRRRP